MADRYLMFKEILHTAFADRGVFERGFTQHRRHVDARLIRAALAPREQRRAGTCVLRKKWRRVHGEGMVRAGE